METRTDFVERSQEAGLPAGEAVASLDGGDGALHVARHQKLRQLQQTVTEHEELQKRRKTEESHRWSQQSPGATRACVCLHQGIQSEYLCDMLIMCQAQCVMLTADSVFGFFSAWLYILSKQFVIKLLSSIPQTKHTFLLKL